MQRQRRLKLILLFIGFGLFCTLYLYQGTDSLAPWVGVSGLVIASLSFIYALRELNFLPEQSTVYILMSSLLLRLATLPIPIVWDDTVYRPIWDGWMQANHYNPFDFVPRSDSLLFFHSDKLYSLLDHVGSFTGLSPFYQILYYPMGWIYELYGLGTTVIVLKVAAILIDILLIYSLIRWAKNSEVKTKHILFLAWNPLYILFISSQGILFQFSLIFLIWFFMCWDRNLLGRASILWGCVMLTSPLGWLGLPYVIRRIGWKSILIIAGTFLIAWLPYLSYNLPTHFMYGIWDSWQYPKPTISIGYFVVYFLVTIFKHHALYWPAIILSILFLLIVIDAFRHLPLNRFSFVRQLFLLSVIYFLITPDLSLGILIALIYLSAASGRFIFLGAVTSGLYFMQLWFYKTASYIVPLIFLGAFIIVFLIWYYKKKSLIKYFTPS